MTTRPLRIGAPADASGLTRDALRYYERQGLLPRSHRTSGGFREYDGSAVDRVRFIKQAQAHGLTQLRASDSHVKQKRYSDRHDSLGRPPLLRCEHPRNPHTDWMSDGFANVASSSSAGCWSWPALAPVGRSSVEQHVRIARAIFLRKSRDRGVTAWPTLVLRRRGR
jgi:hypothetical protein